MNNNNGFIVINRKILEWEWYKDINTVRLFIHCLLKANWKKGNFMGVEVERGSFVTSLPKLSEETSLSISNIRTSLKRLILTDTITSKNHSKFRIITIKNYNEYQDLNRETNSQLTGNQQATNSQLTAIEPINQETNKPNNIIINNIYDFVEQNFGRTLSPLEYEEINTWNDTELTRYAIKQAILSNKCSTKYISRIINAYERENVKTVQQAQEREREYIEARKRNFRKKESKDNAEINLERDKWENE